MYFVVLQSDLCRKFKSSYSDKSINSEDDENLKFEKKTLLSIQNSYAEKSATVDTENETIIEKTTVQVEKSDSDEGDFEVISKEQLNDMADMQNGENMHEGGGHDERRYSISEEGLSEAKDKFPQEITNKSIPTNWNMMELGEKRKRLR